MVCSKFLKHSQFFLCRSLKNIRLSHNRTFSHVLNSHSKVCWGASFNLNSFQSSTLFTPKFTENSKTSKCALPLNFAAFLSTGGSSDTYKIVITNPNEGTSTTLDSPLTSSSGINNEEILSKSSTEITDIASSLPEELSSVADVIEPSLASIGLAHWTPVGLIQMMLEYMHVGMHWPWWITIVVTTLIARILLFPVLLKTQKNAINMSNYLPQLQYLQMKFGEARRTGNSVEAARYANDMVHFMKEKNINPIKNALFPLMQAPVFLSFFLALRGMARAPVESMKDGGIYWVTDLTIPDPYYILPLVACGTMYVVLKIGAESGVKMENMKMAKYFIQALPVVALPFSIYFPSAVLYYWVANNFCTLLIVSILKIQPVRLYFNLPTQQKIDPKFIAPKKGFVQGVKDAIEDQKVIATIEERRRIDEIRFQKAGTGPIPRTYSYDPTKPRPSNVASIASRAVAAKEREV